MERQSSEYISFDTAVWETIWSLFNPHSYMERQSGEYIYSHHYTGNNINNNNTSMCYALISQTVQLTSALYTVSQ